MGLGEGVIRDSDQCVNVSILCHGYVVFIDNSARGSSYVWMDLLMYVAVTDIIDDLDNKRAPSQESACDDTELRFDGKHGGDIAVVKSVGWKILSGPT